MTPNIQQLVFIVDSNESDIHSLFPRFSHARKRNYVACEYGTVSEKQFRILILWNLVVDSPRGLRYIQVPVN